MIVRKIIVPSIIESVIILGRLWSKKLLMFLIITAFPRKNAV